MKYYVDDDLDSDRTMSQLMQTPSLRVPSEVLAFAAEQGVSACLPAVLEITQRIFPDAHLSVRIEDDPEIPHDRHIVFDLDVSLDASGALAAQRAWNDALFRCCPAPLVCVFRLSMELVEA